MAQNGGSRSSLLQDILACNLLRVNQCFGEIFRLDLQVLLTAVFTLVSFLDFFNPEDVGDIFLRNDGWLSVVSMALYPRSQNSSYPPFSEPQMLHANLIFIAFAIRPNAG
jgi:hypothetical protein